ncbi:MAG: DAK2 domain-containing protein, partial [Actinomycetota bacterium]|nr:DAK2 domain-containing protein [Actinomycetota bacterium]
MAGTLAVLDAGAVRTWCRTALDALSVARAGIDALNVYPVPDGDTGTNLYLTVQASNDAVEALRPDADLATTVGALARGAFLGARGNSGVILSQLLRGVSSALDQPHPADAAAVAEALQRAAELAYAAVAHPVEGTMLTV